MEVNKELIRKDLNQYIKIIESFNEKDVANDKEFQDFYCEYYKINLNDEVKNTYFSLLEESKSGDLDFDEILKIIYDKHHVILSREVSILLTVANPFRPKCEDYILRDLGLIIPNNGSIDDWCKTYYTLLIKFEEGAANKSTSYIINEFDKEFPEYKNISFTKKLDIVLYEIKDLSIADLYQEILKLLKNQ